MSVPEAMDVDQLEEPSQMEIQKVNPPKDLPYNKKEGKKVSKGNLIDYKEGDLVVSEGELEVITHKNPPIPDSNPPQKSLPGKTTATSEKKKATRQERRKEFSQKKKELKAASTPKMAQMDPRHSWDTIDLQIMQTITEISRRRGLPRDNMYFQNPYQGPQASTSAHPYTQPSRGSLRQRGSYRGRGRGQKAKEGSA